MSYCRDSTSVPDKDSFINYFYNLDRKVGVWEGLTVANINNVILLDSEFYGFFLFRRHCQHDRVSCACHTSFVAHRASGNISNWNSAENIDKYLDRLDNVATQHNIKEADKILGVINKFQGHKKAHKLAMRNQHDYNLMITELKINMQVKQKVINEEIKTSKEQRNPPAVNSHNNVRSASTECHMCATIFTSRNKLFTHIREEHHDPSDSPHMLNVVTRAQSNKESNKTQSTDNINVNVDCLINVSGEQLSQLQRDDPSLKRYFE
ncbi:hypothetical protein Btru_077175 [Bulinus truncatus]|nr:hypothetical protein Btru_077175 [Bulinus truncatus]